MRKTRVERSFVPGLIFPPRSSISPLSLTNNERGKRRQNKIGPVVKYVQGSPNAIRSLGGVYRWGLGGREKSEDCTNVQADIANFSPPNPPALYTHPGTLEPKRQTVSNIPTVVFSIPYPSTFSSTSRVPETWDQGFENSARKQTISTCWIFFIVNDTDVFLLLLLFKIIKTKLVIQAFESFCFCFDIVRLSYFFE